MFPLQSYDLDKLRSYWQNYKTYTKEITTAERLNPVRYRRMKDIVEAIEYLFNDASEDMQQIIIQRFWNNTPIEEIVSAIHMSNYKIRSMERALLQDTADRLHWV